MKRPSLQEEKKLKNKGYRRIAGIDEAGRGPLAGPVVAAAVCVNFQRCDLPRRSHLIRDSKKLSPAQREKAYKIIICYPGLVWGIGCVSEKVIDRINILEATKLAMEKAVQKLESKLTDVGHPKIYRDVRHSKIDFLILDGNFKINSAIPQKSIVKADEKVFSCACASIIAKVTRDRIMQKYHQKYPQYCFDKHKGYPTKLHRTMLNKYGRCVIHRNSFHYGRTKTKAY